MDPQSVNDQCVAAAKEMFKGYDKELVAPGQRREVQAAFEAYERAPTEAKANAYISAVEALLPPNRLKTLKEKLASLRK